MSLNFRTLDLNLLRVFDAVMAEGSLTGAAAVLAITQPAASHALKRLHEAAGEALFVRHAHGMTPTPRAEALWPQVRAALSSLQQALAPQGFDARSQAASFTLAMTDVGASLLAPALVATIERERALSTLRLRPLTTPDPRPLLQQGEAELAVGHFPQAALAIGSGLDTLLRQALLFDTRYVCLMRRGHPLAESALTLDAYCGAQHLLASAGGRATGAADRKLAELGRRRHIVMTVNQLFTAGRVLARSDLLCVVPKAFLAATGHAQQLQVRELPFDLGSMQVTMLWHLRHDTEPAHRWLRTLVLQAAAASGGTAQSPS